MSNKEDTRTRNVVKNQASDIITEFMRTHGLQVTNQVIGTLQGLRFIDRLKIGIAIINGKK